MIEYQTVGHVLNLLLGTVQCVNLLRNSGFVQQIFETGLGLGSSMLRKRPFAKRPCLGREGYSAKQDFATVQCILSEVPARINKEAKSDRCSCDQANPIIIQAARMIDRTSLSLSAKCDLTVVTS